MTVHSISNHLEVTDSKKKIKTERKCNCSSILQFHLPSILAILKCPCIPEAEEFQEGYFSVSFEGNSIQMWPEPVSGSQSPWVGDTNGRDFEEPHGFSAILRDLLDILDAAVTLTRQSRPHGVPDGQLNVFRDVWANLKYFKLNQFPRGDMLECCTATT